MASKIRVGQTIEQVIPSGEKWYKLEYQNVEIDGLGEWDSENNRFVAEFEGDYFTYLNFNYHSVGKNSHPLWGGIFKNGCIYTENKGQVIAQNYGHQSGNGCPWGKCAALVHMDAGDYLEAWTRNGCPKEQTTAANNQVDRMQDNNFIVFRVP